MRSVVTDALKTPAVTHFFSPPEAARSALNAGVSTATYGALVAAALSSRLPTATLQTVYAWVLLLKRRLK